MLFTESVDDLIDLTQALQKLKHENHSAFITLLNKIKPRLKCQSEGKPFWEILRTYSKERFQLQFLEPLTGEKCADIKLIDPETQESIFIEVSKLGLSEKQVKISEQHRRISNAFVLDGYSMPGAFKQFKYLIEPQVEILLQRIHEMKERAVNHQQFVCYEDDSIIVAVADPSKVDDLDNWCDSHKMGRNHMIGAPQDYNDTYRLIDNGKIVKEIKQLPKGQPGFVYLPVTILYFFVMDLKVTFLSFLDLLKEYPDCLGIVLFSESVGSLLPERNIFDKYSRFIVSQHRGITRHLLFVYNPAFIGNLSKKTFSRLVRCQYLWLLACLGLT